MAETYKPIFPGNWVTHLNAYALPNDDFRELRRDYGEPQDRHHQAVIFCPGWMAVRKVGHCYVGERPTSEFDLIVGSPDLRPDDKPRADIQGLWAPQGAYMIRAGFRTMPASSQPGASSSGPRDEGSIHTGIECATADATLVLASEPPTAAGPIVINGNKVSTASDPDGLVVDASGFYPIGAEMVSSAFGTPQQIAAPEGLTLKLYSTAAGTPAPITSSIIGGAVIVAEFTYMIPEAVVSIDEVHLPGARYSGFGR
ncbi:MAG: hypothetical protein WBM08_05475 [Prochlorococcaceae cyanobacterium]